MIELRWLTRIVVGSDTDPDDEFRFKVLQWRIVGYKDWTDVPDDGTEERVSAYDDIRDGDRNG